MQTSTHRVWIFGGAAALFLVLVGLFETFVAVPELPSSELRELAEIESLIEQKQYDEAASRLRAVLEGEATNRHVALNMLGNVHAARGRLDEALAEYGRALELDPGFVDARNNLAVALARSGRHVEAMQQLEQALRIDPGYGAARANLARVIEAYDAGRGTDPRDERSRAVAERARKLLQ